MHCSNSLELEWFTRENLSGERGLWSSVLQQGLACAARHVLGDSRFLYSEKMHKQDYDWILSNSKKVFSFLWVTELLDIDHEFIRSVFRKKRIEILKVWAAPTKKKYAYSAGDE